MNTLTPLETLFDIGYGRDLTLPPELVKLYGHLHFPSHSGGSYVIGNFVSTLDGVVTLGQPGKSGGGDISGYNQHDQMVMGLLRAIADAVIVGSGTLRAAPRHLWTAQYIYPALADAYQELRSTLGKTQPPLNVIVTARGEINLNRPVFQSGEVPVLIVTTRRGADCIYEQHLPPAVQVSAVPGTDILSVSAILEAVNAVRQSDRILVEAGPQLMGDFLAEHYLNELFLTLAPQIAGRDRSVERPGFVVGKLFAPEHPLWGTLISVRRAGSHLFLRYAFETHKQA
jgi:riboflavin biosynthesis pyrimidine reductase